MLQPVKWAAAAVLALAVEVAAASAPGMPAALPLRRTLSGRPAAGASAARARPDLRILKPLRGGGGGDEEAVSAPVMVTFSVECHQTTVGESIGIVGSCAELGNWHDIAVTSRRTITKPVEKSSNLVPGCVARVRSYPKIAALSVEATQSEAEAVAQEPASTAQEAEEEEKSGMRCYFCASFS